MALFRRNAKPPTKEQLEKIASSQINHAAGRRHRMADGTEYVVTKSGAWKRLTPRSCDSSKNTKNNGVRRRKGA